MPTDFLKHTFSGYSNPPQTISVDSIVGAGYEGWRAADGVLTDAGMWYALNFEAGWWKLDCGVGNTFLLDNYSLATASLNATKPKAWTMQGSNNDSAWDTLDSRTGLTLSASTTYNYVCATRTTYYRYFKWAVTDTEGGRPAIREFYLFGDAPAGGIVIPVFMSQYRRRRVS
jgi:hypothetical protein